MSSSTAIESISKKDRKALDSQQQNEPYTRSFPFFKSPEGIAEYEKIGMKYPRTMPDEWYDKFLKVTRNTKKEDYKIYIPNMKRFIRSSGEEFIIYAMTETRYDGLHNRKKFNRGGMGMYAKPIPHREIKARITEEEGLVQDIITTVEAIETGYSIPFIQKNIDKLIKYTDGNTAYSIQKEDYRSGQRYTIRSLNDWRNGKTEELLRFGHIASDYEKQILEDEKQGKFTHMGTPPAGGAGLYK
jgi:hypothetical protein